MSSILNSITYNRVVLDTLIGKKVLSYKEETYNVMKPKGNEKTKEATTNEIKDYYDNEDFNSNDVYDIAKDTTKENELFDYAKVPSYLKSSKHFEKNKDDYEISM